MARQMAHFSYDPVNCQKMVILSVSPEAGIFDMNGGGVVVCRKIDQMTVANPIDRTDVPRIKF